MNGDDIQSISDQSMEFDEVNGNSENNEEEYMVEPYNARVRGEEDEYLESDGDSGHSEPESEMLEDFEENNEDDEDL